MRVHRSMIAALFIGLGSVYVHADDKVITVPDDDAAMNAAIAKARSRLPKFWTRLASPQPGDSYFSLKLRFTDGDIVEHFWCDSVNGNESAATCTIGNESNSVKTVHLGDVVAVKNEDISDWMIMTSQRIVGAETLRALLPRMSKEEAEGYRALLTDE